MPFRSKAQARLFYAKERDGEFSPKMVREWQDATPSVKDLPARLHARNAKVRAANKKKGDSV